METNQDKKSSKLSLILNRKIFSLIPLRIIFGACLGLLFGYLYYTFIGCSTNSCSITSDPIMTMSIFGFGGVLIAIK